MSLHLLTKDKFNTLVKFYDISSLHSGESPGCIIAPMKKTFQLKPEGKQPDRVLEAIKHEIRKYVKRQRRVPLPAGVDFWDFDCRFGATEAVATSVHFATLTALMDGIAKAGGDAFYVEILAKDGHRQVRAQAQPPEVP
jgi:hypothetical protein